MPNGTSSIVRTPLCTIAFSSSLAAGASGALARPAAHAAPGNRSATTPAGATGGRRPPRGQRQGAGDARSRAARVVGEVQDRRCGADEERDAGRYGHADLAA